MLGCCGVISDWAGRYELFEQTTQFLREQLEKLGNPKIIAGCPTCMKTLSGAVSGDVVGIWEILEDIGLPEGPLPAPRPMALHDACGARGDAATQQSIRRIARSWAASWRTPPTRKISPPAAATVGSPSTPTGKWPEK